MSELSMIKGQIELQRAQITLEKKRLKELIRKAVLLDFRHDLEKQHEKLPTSVSSKMIDCVNFILDV